MKHLLHTIKLRFFFVGWIIAILLDQRNGRDTGGEYIEPTKGTRGACLLYAGLTGASLVMLLWIFSGVIG